MKPAIEVTHLTKHYGPVTALDDVTLCIEQDSITGILGRNGAGKTVLMSVITAQEAPSAGTIRVFGQSPWENASVLSRTCFIRDNQRYPDEYKLAHVLRVGPLFYENWDSDLATGSSKPSRFLVAAPSVNSREVNSRPSDCCWGWHRGLPSLSSMSRTWVSTSPLARCSTISSWRTTPTIRAPWWSPPI